MPNKETANNISNILKESLKTIIEETSTQDISTKFKSFKWDNLSKLYEEILTATSQFKDEYTVKLAKLVNDLVVATDLDKEIILKNLLPKVFDGGNWDKAKEYAKDAEVKKPWLIVAIGPNCIGKSGFLRNNTIANDIKTILKLEEKEYPPTGEYSFFRQLDYLIPAVGAVYFKLLYQFSNNPDLKLLKNFEDYKILLKHIIFDKLGPIQAVWASIIAKLAFSHRMNMIVESTGAGDGTYPGLANLAFASSNSYQKLFLRFTIDAKSSLIQTQTCIQKRYDKEITKGTQLLQKGIDKLTELYVVNDSGSATYKMIKYKYKDVVIEPQYIGIILSDSLVTWYENIFITDKYKDWKKLEAKVTMVNNLPKSLQFTRLTVDNKPTNLIDQKVHTSNNDAFKRYATQLSLKTIDGGK